MITRCKHCNQAHNTHNLTGWTCGCGRPIDELITVIGTLTSPEVELVNSKPWGPYGGICYYSRRVAGMTHRGRDVYLDKKHNLYVFGTLK